MLSVGKIYHTWMVWVIYVCTFTPDKYGLLQGGDPITTCIHPGLIRQVRGGRFQVKEAKGLGQHILAETNHRMISEPPFSWVRCMLVLRSASENCRGFLGKRLCDYPVA